MSLSSTDSSNLLVSNGNKPNKGIAVALQSSFLGFYAHAGFMEALHTAGIRPAEIAGASSGAVAAALYACGIQGPDLTNFVSNRRFLNSWREFRGILRFVSVLTNLRGHGMLSGNGVVQYLRNHLPVEKIEQCTHARLQIAVTNLTHKRAELSEMGDLAEHVVASCSLAPIVRSRLINNCFYADGGFTNDLPFEQWIDRPDIHTIILHQIRHDPAPVLKVHQGTTFISCFCCSHEAMTVELQRLRMEKARLSGKRVLVFETITNRPSAMKLNSAVMKLLVEQGKHTFTNSCRVLSTQHAAEQTTDSRAVS